MSFFALMLPVIPVMTLVWWVWADQRMRGMGVGRGWRWAQVGAMVLFMAGYGWMIGERKGWWAADVPVDLYSLTLLWGVLFLPLLGLPTMLGWSFWTLGRRLRRWRVPLKRPVVETSGGKWTRRKFLGAAAVSLPVVGTFGTVVYSVPRLSRFRVREITVAIEDLPQALDGMRIAHVTDTHIGKFTNAQGLDEIVAATNELAADLVLFTGDLIDNKLRDLPAGVAMLKKIRPGAGLFVIEGNHDRFDNAEGFEKEVRASGLALLRNEAVTVQVRGVPVQILGTVWAYERDEIEQAVDKVAALREPGAFPILMAHHPHAFDRAVERGFPLTLSGHTHGGQLMLTEGLGAGPVLFRYWTGLYQKLGHSLVVSNGIGNWFPLRVNAPAEIVHLTLRRA